MRRIFSWLLQAIGIVSVGLFVRYRRGHSMLDPFFFIPFACLSVVLAGAILAGLWKRRGDPPRVQVYSAVARACGWMSMILAVSLASLNLMPWRGEWALPEWTT